jgi:hypothetical protein
MLIPARRCERCRHLIEIKQPDGAKETAVYYCEGFPDGIPDEIAFGDNEHSKPLPNQGNDTVYERSDRILRVLNIEKGEGGWWSVLVDEKDAYRDYSVKGDETWVDAEASKSFNSKDHRVFAEQLGKFTPHVRILNNPITVEKLNEKDIKEAYRKMPMPPRKGGVV